MATRQFDADTLRVMSDFERTTGVAARDCILADNIYILVQPGTAARAIGKGGRAIKATEAKMGRRIKIFEWAEQPAQFVKNLVPGAQSIRIAGGIATVALAARSRAAVIGRAGCNIRALCDLLSRNSELKELRVRQKT